MKIKTVLKKSVEGEGVNSSGGGKTDPGNSRIYTYILFYLKRGDLFMTKVKYRCFLIAFLTAVMMFSSIGQTFALTEEVPDTQLRKIVVFDSSLTDEGHKDRIIEKVGAKKIKDLRLINAAVVSAGSVEEKLLKVEKGVLRVDPDVSVSVSGKPAKPAPDPAPAQQTPLGVDRIDAELAWPQNTGQGVKVAVLDTGIDLTHPDLAANIKGGYNAVKPRKSPADDNGHGTHVAGIITAVNDNIGVVGVAPQAELYAVKVLGANGSGYLSDLIEGLEWSINNNVQVINMSLGTPAEVQSFHDAVTKVYNAGIVMVAAAGNSGPGDNTVEYPAKYEEVIAVSATDENDAIASFSSRGPEIELSAPGVGIYSTYKGGGYETFAGTSMAAPHVTGTAALVIKRGIQEIQNIRSELQATADKMGKPELYGYGLVDAEEAATGYQSLP